MRSVGKWVGTSGEKATFALVRERKNGGAGEETQSFEYQRQ